MAMLLPSLAGAPRRPPSVNTFFKSAAYMSLSHNTMQAQSTLKSQFWGAQLHLKHDESGCTFSNANAMVQVQARLFQPAIFEASKLKVIFLGEGKDKRPDEMPRAYTLTHSDITSKLTLAVSQTINKAQLQGWYTRLQRDEVLAEWRKSQGRMSLHVHCHISGGHLLLDFIAHLRFYIFRKELPVVLEAFRYGDVTLFRNHPDLEEALVWVYFHSNEKEYNRVECWGPLRQATKGCMSEEARKAIHRKMKEHESTMCPQESTTPIMSGTVDVPSKIQGANADWKMPMQCPHPCECCFPPLNAIHLPSYSFQSSHDWYLHNTKQQETNRLIKKKRRRMINNILLKVRGNKNLLN